MPSRNNKGFIQVRDRRYHLDESDHDYYLLFLTPALKQRCFVL
jgi:hypothetical protein